LDRATPQADGAGRAAQDFPVFDRIAVNLLELGNSSQRGIKGKRRKAA
jgi:hypothetical protein